MWKNFSFSGFNFSLVLFIFLGNGGGGGVMELFSDEDDEFISKSLHVPLSRANASISAELFDEVVVVGEGGPLADNCGELDDMIVIIFEGDEGGSTGEPALIYVTLLLGTWNVLNCSEFNFFGDW